MSASARWKAQSSPCPGECLLVGYGMAVYVILDIEYPRLAFIRVDAFDQALVDLRADMK